VFHTASRLAEVVDEVNHVCWKRFGPQSCAE
jgi:hypothetical protein